MNCPKDRKKFQYLPDLSAPHLKLLTYYCTRCQTVYAFKELTESSASTLWGTVSVFRRKLTELDLERGIFTREPPTKTSSSSRSKVLARSL